MIEEMKNSDVSIDAKVAFNQAVQQPLNELAAQTKHIFVKLDICKIKQQIDSSSKINVYFA